MSPSRPLAGLRVVITGASAGLGAELARQLSARGCRLILGARRLDALRAVEGECRQLARAAGTAAADFDSQCLACDVTDRGELAALAAAAQQHFGGIDVWVSNAGSGVRHAVLQATDDDMLAMYRLHCLAALHAYQIVAPGWIAAGHRGQFVDICSVGGRSGYPWNAAYSAAKHALSAVSDVARLELASSGITVTTVYPGATTTDFSASSPDRSGGASVRFVRRSREHAGLLRRLVATPQPAAWVAARIVSAIASRQSAVSPHRWSNLAAAAYRTFPGPVSRMIGRQLERPVADSAEDPNPGS